MIRRIDLALWRLRMAYLRVARPAEWEEELAGEQHASWHEALMEGRLHA